MNYTCCTHCVLDVSDSFITFDDKGVCNYCNEYRKKEKEFIREKESKVYDSFISRIKKSRKQSEYDCIIGISGGLDSSWLLYLAKQSGLNPLAVHYDCGWNTENAVNNIEKLVNQLKVDLYTYVVNWEEFRDVQLAYLKAGVVDLEIPTDHSFMASLYKTAAKFKVKYILTGHNFVTEGIMPRSWVYNKGDAVNLMDIHRRFGKIKRLESFPVINLINKFYYYNVKRIENVHLLNYADYVKSTASKILAEQFDWKQHPVKHGESIWTRFYQCYILPARFGIDKRRAHLSTLICSGQITREEALNELLMPVYDPHLFHSDKEFVQKKFGITDHEMDQYMLLSNAKHEDYKTDLIIKQAYNAIRNTFSLTKDLKISHRY